MEQSARKLLEEVRLIRLEREKLNEREAMVRRALELVDLRPEGDRAYTEMEGSIGPSLFSNGTMPQCCETIFQVYDGWLDKRQMEYLLALGGYRFEAKDPTNSVDVTLRRMAEKGDCEVEKRGGSKGNRYRKAKR
jgi:hypothetical protein